MLELKRRDNAVIVAVRVQPRASCDEIAGVVNGEMKVRLHAPALEDRANEALCAYLAELLKRPKAAVRILSGHRSRSKRVEIRGVTEREILRFLEREG